MALTEKEKNTLQEIVNRLKSTANRSREYMENEADDKFSHTDLFQKYWISNVSNEAMVDLLEVTFDLESTDKINRE